MLAIHVLLVSIQHSLFPDAGSISAPSREQTKQQVARNGAVTVRERWYQNPKAALFIRGSVLVVAGDSRSQSRCSIYFDLRGCEPAGGSTFGAANGYASGTTFTPVVNLNGYAPPDGKVSSTKYAL